MTHRLWNSRGLDVSAGSKLDSSTQTKQQQVVKQKQGQSQPSSKVAPTLHGGLAPRTKKPTKLIRMPTSCVRRLRDAYVAFMMSIAGKRGVNMGAVACTSWQCAAPSRYPGQQRRFEKSDEEVACSSIVLATPATAKGMQISRSPPCARKAVFPL